MKSVLREAVDRALVAGQEPPAIRRAITVGVRAESLRCVVGGVDGDRHETQVWCVGELALKLRELEALRRARLRAVGVDEVDHSDVPAQIVTADATSGPLGQRERGHTPVAVEALEAHIGRRCPRSRRVHRQCGRARDSHDRDANGYHMTEAHRESYPCGYGVGVRGPRYFASIAFRTSVNGLPAPRISITSRVMSRQTVQVAAWLVNVSVPSLLKDLM